MTRSLGEKLTSSAAVLTFGLGLTALFLDVENWYVIFVVGWFLVVPLLAILFGTDEDTVGDRVADEIERSIEDELVGDRADDRDGFRGEIDPEDALDVLRERYARGELDDEEFERKVRRLLETETLADAEDLFGTGRSADEDREPATERS